MEVDSSRSTDNTRSLLQRGTYGHQKFFELFVCGLILVVFTMSAVYIPLLTQVDGFSNGDTDLDNQFGRLTGLSVSYGVQVMAGVFLVVLNLVCLVTAVVVYKTRHDIDVDHLEFRRTRYNMISWIYVLCLVLDLFGLAFPSVGRTAYVTISMVLKIVFLCRDVLHKTEFPTPADGAELYGVIDDIRLQHEERMGGGDGVPSPLGGVGGGGGDADEDVDALKRRMQSVRTLVELKDIRVQYYVLLRSGNYKLVLLCLLVFILALLNFIGFYYQTVSQSRRVFVSSELDLLNDRMEVDQYWDVIKPDTVTTPLIRNFSDGSVQRDYYGTRNDRLLLVVLDGFRWDYMEKNDDFREAFLENDTFSRDAVVLRMEAQLPSMSVPNWVTLVTGTKPEITGVMGNIQIPETPFDSIFRMAQDFSYATKPLNDSIGVLPDVETFMRGVTGSPWFGDIVHSTLPLLEGRGTVPTDYGISQGDKSTADVADWRRGEIAQYAMSRGFNPYKLFLAHFSDVDVQGHDKGVDAKWNKADTYQGSVTNKTRIVSQLIDTVRAFDDATNSRTTVLITSDHGHIDSGGHGGVSHVLRDVPLIFWRHGSNLRAAQNSLPQTQLFGSRLGSAPSNPYAPGQQQEQFIDNTYVAATVAVLLGMPVPRQCQGVFVDAALPLMPDNHSYRTALADLFLQKQAFVRAFMLVMDMPSSNFDEPLLGHSSDEVNGWDEEQLVANIAGLMDYYDNQRAAAFRLRLVRNVILVTLICIAILVQMVHTANTSTAVGIRSLFFRKTPDRTINLRSFFKAFGILAVYLAVCLILYLVTFAVLGYDKFDSTVIHTPQVVPIYFVVCILPSTIMAFLAMRIYHLPYMIFPLRPRPEEPLRKKISWCLTCIRRVWFLRQDVSFNTIADLAHIYLIRSYLLMLTVSAALLLFVCQSLYGFIVPYVFQQPFISEIIWATRFRVLTIQFMMLPILVANMLYMGFWPKFLPFADNRSYVTTRTALNRKEEKPQCPYDSLFLLTVHQHQDKNRRTLDHDPNFAPVHAACSEILNRHEQLLQDGDVTHTNIESLCDVYYVKRHDVKGRRRKLVGGDSGHHFDFAADHE